jgi:hypothetical protein
LALKETAALSTHEQTVAHSSIKTASDKSFGLTVGGILAAIALVRWWWVGSLSWLMMVFLVVGVALVVAALLQPRALAPLNKLWTKLGLVLFYVVNPVVMLLLFIVTIIPAGLIMRAVGHDPMRRRFNADLDSYWIERDPPGPPPESLRNQF